MSLADQHYRWVIVAFTIVLQAVNVGILTYCFALFSLPWLDEFAAPRRDVMLTISFVQVGMGVISPFVGGWLDRIPMRLVVISGALLLGLGLWLSQLVTALWQLWLIYATIMPLSTALMGTLAAQTLVAKWFSSQRGLALGLSAIGTNVGGVIFPTVVAAMLASYGWRETFVYLAWLAIGIVVPLALIVLRRTPVPVEVSSATDPTSATAALSLRDTRLWSTQEILSTPLFWLPFLSLIPLTMAFGALQFNLGGLVRDMRLEDGVTAGLITISAIAMVLGKLFFGSLGDRVDHRYLFWLSAAAMYLSCILLLSVESQLGLTVAVIAMGLSGGGILPLMGVIFGSRFGAASFGKVMGFVMLNVLVAAFSPTIAGWFYDVSGSYDWAWIGLMLVSAPALVAMYWLPE